MEHISKTKAFNELKKRSEITERQDVINRYIQKLEDLESVLEEEYPKLSVYFSNYTDHGWKHTIKVLNYMFDFVYKPERLSDTEIMLMIFAALLHDIGMACNEEEATELIPQMEPMKKEDIIERIRERHGEFAGAKIKKLSNGKFEHMFRLCIDNATIENWDTEMIIADICCSHTKPIHWIQTRWGDKKLIYIACLLRLADLLDADGNRAKHAYPVFDKKSGMHNLLNYVIGNSNKIIKEAEEACQGDCINKREHRPCGRCYKRIGISIAMPLHIEDDDKAYLMRMINDYKNDIEAEIIAVSKTLEKTDESYSIKIFPTIKCDIIRSQPDDSPQIDVHKFAIDYSAIKLLLFEEQFYANKWCGVREIIQNAYDACKAFGESEHSEMEWRAKITIKLEESENTIIIRDNGIGMTDFVIKEYFLNFGKSIFNFEPEYLYDKKCKNHIGHFGIGFFAAFMLSSKIIVKTQTVQCATSTIIELDKESSFATLKYNCPPISHGTEIIFDYEEFKAALIRKDEENFKELLTQYIQEYFLHDEIEIYVSDESEENPKSLSLRKFPDGEGDAIGKYLNEMKAKIKVSVKEFPPIFYALSRSDLQKVEYDELLKRLASNGGKRRLPYLDAGTFLVFSEDNSIEEDFKKWAGYTNPRRNYSPNSCVSDSIPIKIDVFCGDNKLSSARYCEYGFLDFVTDGNSGALCDMDIICARVKNKMRLNDACGEPPRDDMIFLRNVFLPSLHICLPNLNFRYKFDWLFANICTDKVYPTVMRNTLTDDRIKELSYAIGYGITRFRIEKGWEIIENQLILKNFYSQLDENIFIKGGL